MELCYKPGCLTSALRQSAILGCDIIGYKCSLLSHPVQELFQVSQYERHARHGCYLLLIWYFLHSA